MIIIRNYLNENLNFNKSFYFYIISTVFLIEFQKSVYIFINLISLILFIMKYNFFCCIYYSLQMYNKFHYIWSYN